MTAKSEQETVIRFSADEDTAHIWTASPAIKRKMDRIKAVPVRVTKRDGEESGWFYEVPVKELRWKVGRRKVSDAARKAASIRLSATIAARKSNKSLQTAKDTDGKVGPAGNTATGEHR